MTANYEQPNDMNKRVRFYDGQFLQDQDFVDEQKYHVDRRQRLARFLHVAGIADGLAVRTTSQPFQVRVTAGTAVDRGGRLVVLAAMKTILDSDGRALLAAASEPVTLPPEAASGERWLYMAYHQMPDDLQASGDGVEGETRWHEAPYLFTAVAPLGDDDTYVGPAWHDFLTAGPPPPVLLARLTLSADGNVTVDNNVRRYSGLRLPGLRDGSQAAALRAGQDGRVGLWLLKDGDPVEHLSVTEKGYVGLGSPAPNAALEIRTELKATVQNRALVGLHIAPNFNANNLNGVRQYGLIVENGSVGIGTTTPESALHVHGDGYTVYGPNSTWGARLQVGGNGRTTDLASVVATNGNLHLDAHDGSFATYINYYSRNNTYLNVQGGNVGIGTDAPGARLDVSGTVRSVGGVVRAGNDAANYTEIGHGGVNGYINMVGVGRLDFRHEGSNVLCIQDNGSVGIGINSPAQKLHVSGGNAIVNNVYLGDVGHSDTWAGFSHRDAVGTNSYGLLQHTAGTYTLINKRSGGGYIALRVDNVDKMILNDAGNVGIGTSSPNEKLEVSGNLLLSGNNNITTRRGLLRMGTTDGSSATSGEVVGAIGFWGFGQQHGQLSFRAGQGFEMVDRSANGPTLNYNRDQYPYADLKVRYLHLNEWTLSAEGNHLFIKHGNQVVARFSVTRDRFQVYRNLNNRSPYFYYNEDGNYANYSG